MGLEPPLFWPPGSQLTSQLWKQNRSLQILSTTSYHMLYTAQMEWPLLTQPPGKGCFQGSPGQRLESRIRGRAGFWRTDCTDTSTICLRATVLKMSSADWKGSHFLQTLQLLSPCEASSVSRRSTPGDACREACQFVGWNLFKVPRSHPLEGQVLGFQAPPLKQWVSQTVSFESQEWSWLIIHPNLTQKNENISPPLKLSCLLRSFWPTFQETLN